MTGSVTFVSKTTIINNTWLNDVDALVWDVFAGATTVALAKTALGIGAAAFPSSVQGDTFFASASDTITALAKNTSATRYLSNTGASNNPAWAQVALGTGVSGTLPIANGGTAATTASAARTALGLGTSATADASAVAITGGTITGITDLAVADGGTGSSTAANARTALGAMQQVLTTRGDIVRGGVAGVPERVALGTSGQVLASDGTDVVWSSAPATAAAQADQEVGSSTTLFTTPGRQHFHPSAAKFWLEFSIAGTIAISYNVTSVTDNGVGDFTLTIATDLSSASYCVVSSVQDSNPPVVVGFASPITAGSFGITSRLPSSGVLTDSAGSYGVAVFGDI